MKIRNLVFLLLILLTASLGSAAQTQVNSLEIKPLKKEIPIPQNLYGIFFEDINFGADGGLYAELVKNRSFEFPQALMGWYTFGKVELKNDGPFERNPHYVRLSSSGHPHKHTGIENEGFRGMGFQKGENYRFSVWARSASGEQKIRVELIDEQNNVIEKKDLLINGSEWGKNQVILTANNQVEKGRLRIFLVSDGPLDLEHVSLFPVNTWKGRENGMRNDLAKNLNDLKPGVFRFPGGCIVEGTDLATRYNWKNTVGIIENRPLNENRWHYTFPNRFFPDYFQSYGLGFFEFFQLCEDFGADALPVLSVGLACQFQNDKAEAHCPVHELDPYIQDALDLIEFANGPTTSAWGKLRAEMGHEAPFGLKMIAIGNEQWGPEYPERLVKFNEAIRAKYPEIKIIGSSGPSAEGKQFDYLWPEMKRLKVDLVDEHYYKSPEWFFTNARRYDNYDRTGPKVFAGEYASHDGRIKKNSFRAALSEAAFLTGIERNADVVHLATYAPLFAHVDGWQWRPDLIWFDNLRSVRSANWYVQQLYSHYKGTHVLSATLNKQTLGGENGLYASAVIDKTKNQVIVKIANNNTETKILNLDLSALAPKNLKNSKQIIFRADPEAENTLDQPNLAVPTEKSLTNTTNKIEVNLEAESFNLFIFDL